MKYATGLDEQCASFQPIPFLGNPHVQTLLGNVVLTGPDFPYRSLPRRIDLGDGDSLVAHDSVPNSWVPGDPIAVLVHGLGGSHLSPPIQRMALLASCSVIEITGATS